jgi:hypothetical protein
MLNASLTADPFKSRSQNVRVWTLCMMATFNGFMAGADSSIRIPTPPVSQPRLEQPLPKGVELYSWRHQQTWMFSLVIGTNRDKRTEEITSASVSMNGVATLKARLSRLAVGEQVFWFNPKATPFEYPSANVMAELVQFCAKQSIKLHLSTGR